MNLTGQDADGVVHVGHASTAGSRWLLKDLLGDASFVRSSDDLADGGLYVALPAWGTHVFVATPVTEDADLHDAATGGGT